MYYVVWKCVSSDFDLNRGKYTRRRSKRTCPLAHKTPGLLSTWTYSTTTELIERGGQKMSTFPVCVYGTYKNNKQCDRARSNPVNSADVLLCQDILFGRDSAQAGFKAPTWIWGINCSEFWHCACCKIQWSINCGWIWRMIEYNSWYIRMRYDIWI